MLDATAGNRSLWWGANQNRFPPNTVFLDINIGLTIPPDIFADNTQCPFRDGVFDVVLFDPPWGINMPPWFGSDKEREDKSKSYYGNFKNKRELFNYINKAQKELSRVGKRLCLKWGERNITLWKILPFFKAWTQINCKRHITSRTRGKKPTWWVTFVKSSEFVHNSDKT